MKGGNCKSRWLLMSLTFTITKNKMHIILSLEISRDKTDKRIWRPPFPNPQNQSLQLAYPFVFISFLLSIRVHFHVCLLIFVNETVVYSLYNNTKGILKVIIQLNLNRRFVLKEKVINNTELDCVFGIYFGQNSIVLYKTVSMQKVFL